MLGASRVSLCEQVVQHAYGHRRLQNQDLAREAIYVEQLAHKQSCRHAQPGGCLVRFELSPFFESFEDDFDRLVDADLV